VAEQKRGAAETQQQIAARIAAEQAQQQTTALAAPKQNANDFQRLKDAVDALVATGVRFPMSGPSNVDDPMYRVVNIAYAMTREDPPQHNDACCIVNPVPGKD